MNDELNSYLSSLIEETHLCMDEFHTPEMAFTATILNKITDLLDCEEPILEHCRLQTTDGKVIGEIHAYAESSNGEVLYLFYSDYNYTNEIKTKSNAESQIDVNRPQGFYRAATRCVYEDHDSDTNEYKALKYIYDNQHRFTSIQLVILSNFIIRDLTIKKISIASKPVFLDVWDLKKIYGNMHSMSDHVAIDIDFESKEYIRFKIPFIQMESSQYQYKCIQAMFPAKLLYQLYERYNTNLLYNNVRYFLGLKGTRDKKPNVAMLETLRTENEMFLAYNNGITALAKGVESVFVGEKTDVTDPESGASTQYVTMGILKKILDFRIINGGQTTAAIFNAKNLSKTSNDPKKKVNLLGVYVQVKLIISDEIEKLSGKITLSSNFQNKIKYSDFSVSNEFNTQLERLSRSIMMPNPNNEPKYWYYERLRGQYDEQKKLLNTKADREYFDFQFPNKLKFTKEIVAKVWMAWSQSPCDAVKGSSTTYAIYMKDISSRNFIPDETYYKQTVALIIIYKFLMSRPENRTYANGKATVVAYALALLGLFSFGRFDLLALWKKQTLSDNSKIFLNSLCDELYKVLQTRADSLNTTILSYGKTKAAYDYIRGVRFNVNTHLLDDDLLL